MPCALLVPQETVADVDALDLSEVLAFSSWVNAMLEVSPFFFSPVNQSVSACALSFPSRLHDVTSNPKLFLFAG